MADQKMNKYAVRKEIAALIDSIKEHSDNIGTHKHIPQLELELILHKIEKLYQKSIVFNYLNSIDGGESMQAELSRQHLVEETVQVPAEEKKEPVAETKVPEQKPAEEIPAPELKKEPPVQKEEPKPAEEIKTPEPPKQEAVVPPKQETTAPPAKNRPDIRSFVSFNEKIMFIRILFGGDAAAYDESMNQINGCQSLEEAMAFVSVLQGEYSWKEGDEAAAAFHYIVKRRFA